MMTTKITKENLNLRPRNDWVAIVPLDQNTEGGLELVQDYSKPGYYEGRVLDVGPAAQSYPVEDGLSVECLRKGNRVIFFSDRSTPIFAGGNLLLVKDKDIIGVFHHAE